VKGRPCGGRYDEEPRMRRFCNRSACRRARRLRKLSLPPQVAVTAFQARTGFAGFGYNLCKDAAAFKSKRATLTRGVATARRRLRRRSPTPHRCPLLSRCRPRHRCPLLRRSALRRCPRGRPAAAGGGTSFGGCLVTVAFGGRCWREQRQKGRQIGHGGWRQGGRSSGPLNRFGAWGRELLGWADCR